MSSQKLLVTLSVGVLAGAMLVGGVLFAQSSPPKTVSTADDGPFDIVDTAGSTYLLNRKTGQVWRLGFAEVKGDRYWFGTYVPLQGPTGFTEFQENLRRRATGQAP